MHRGKDFVFHGPDGRGCMTRRASVHLVDVSRRTPLLTLSIGAHVDACTAGLPADLPGVEVMAFVGTDRVRVVINLAPDGSDVRHLYRCLGVVLDTLQQESPLQRLEAQGMRLKFRASGGMVASWRDARPADLDNVVRVSDVKDMCARLHWCELGLQACLRLEPSDFTAFATASTEAHTLLRHCDFTRIS